jgi:hypothetical protein
MNFPASGRRRPRRGDLGPGGRGPAARSVAQATGQVGRDNAHGEGWPTAKAPTLSPPRTGLNRRAGGHAPHAGAHHRGRDGRVITAYVEGEISAAELYRRTVARYLGEVNALHPLSEGNRRAQRAFFGQLARDAGFTLAWQHLDLSATLRPLPRSCAAIQNRCARCLMGSSGTTPNRADPIWACPRLQRRSSDRRG